MDTSSKKFTIVDRDGFTIALEYNKQVPVLHLPRVEKFNKTTYLDITVAVDEIGEFLADMDYPWMFIALEPNNTVIEKLTKKLGFEYQGTDKGITVYGKEII